MVVVVVLLPWGIHCNLHKLEILIQSPTSVLLQACSHVRLGGSSDCLDGQDGEYLLSWPWASSFCLYHLPFAVFALMSIFLINDCWTRAGVAKTNRNVQELEIVVRSCSYNTSSDVGVKPVIVPSTKKKVENPHHVVFGPCHYSHLYVIRDRCNWVPSKLSSPLN